jgi:hypothetical protein
MSGRVAIRERVWPRPFRHPVLDLARLNFASFPQTRKLGEKPIRSRLFALITPGFGTLGPGQIPGAVLDLGRAWIPTWIRDQNVAVADACAKGRACCVAHRPALVSLADGEGPLALQGHVVPEVLGQLHSSGAALRQHPVPHTQPAVAVPPWSRALARPPDVLVVHHLVPTPPRKRGGRPRPLERPAGRPRIRWRGRTSSQEGYRWRQGGAGRRRWDEGGLMRDGSVSWDRRAG